MDSIDFEENKVATTCVGVYDNSEVNIHEFSSKQLLVTKKKNTETHFPSSYFPIDFAQRNCPRMKCTRYLGISVRSTKCIVTMRTIM